MAASPLIILLPGICPVKRRWMEVPLSIRTNGLPKGCMESSIGSLMIKKRFGILMLVIPKRRI